VNKIDGVRSTYMWKGAVETDTEALLMVKTTVDKLGELTSFVQEKHPYDVPETIAAAIVGGNAAYLKWVADSVK
jgi:periplasmic divalent cation tolerance protein